MLLSTSCQIILGDIFSRSGYDYFLLPLRKSSFWFTKKHFFKIIIYFFNTWKCAAFYVIWFEVYDGCIG